MLEGLAPKNYAPAMCALMMRAHQLLDEADRKILEDALANPLFPALNLAQQLTERGFAIGETSIRKHRNRKCPCARKSN